MIYFSTLNNSLAEDWEFVVNNKKGDAYFNDRSNIEISGGFLYFWNLGNWKKSAQGMKSVKRYMQGDCNLFRYKIITFSFHKEPMGNGLGLVQKPVERHKGWKYPQPDSTDEIILKDACQRN